MESEESRFHCSWEWHLAKLGSLCAVVYSWSWRISKNSERFGVSASSAGQYFGRHRNTMGNIYSKLVKAGFFRLIEAGKSKGGENIYAPVSHEDWAKEHPNCCCQKRPDLTVLNNDSLGRELYAASGGKVKVKDFQLAW